MTAINGNASGPTAGDAGFANEALEQVGTCAPGPGCERTPEGIKLVVAKLEVPFDPKVIEWRVTHTATIGRQLRGQLIPYACPRAYTDRLNDLFTPAGWTRQYAVHTSPNFQRREDQRTVAKVFVTCELRIYGLGSHSATGEEWADDPNAGTSAEAQAFKRACSCFGLGRYLYYFSGIWVDLDERKRPMTRPVLADWATPDGWRQGLRPESLTDGKSRDGNRHTHPAKERQLQNNSSTEVTGRTDLMRQIEAMAEPLGRGLYRGLLKTVAGVWRPSEVRDGALLLRVLMHMRAADRGLQRLEVALDQTGRESLNEVLRSLNLNSLDRVDCLETLHRIVVALEEKAQGHS